MPGRQGQLSGRKVPNSVKKLVLPTDKRSLINFNEPEVPAILPPMPLQLSDAAKELYYKVGSQLVRAGILKETDGFTLASYCQVTADVLEAFEQNKKLKRMQQTSGGVIHYDRLNPIKLLQLQRQLAAELGLSPAMRGRIEVNKTDDTEKEWEVFDATE